MCAPRDQRKSSDNQPEQVGLNALRWERRALITPGSRGPALFGARYEQDHLHEQEGRTTDRILMAAVHGLQRINKVREAFVPGEQIEIASNGLLGVILEHGDDQLVFALEIRVKRPAREAGRGGNGFDTGAADALFLEYARRRFQQLFASIIPGRSGSGS